MQFSSLSNELLLNGLPAKKHYPMQDGDVLTIKPPQRATVHFLAHQLHMTLNNKIEIAFQGKSLTLQKPIMDVLVNRQVATLDTIIQSGDHIQFIALNQDPWTYQDVFRFSNWQIPNDFKGTFQILKNEQPVAFDVPIFGGDQLTIELIPT